MEDKFSSSVKEKKKKDSLSMCLSFCLRPSLDSENKTEESPVRH